MVLRLIGVLMLGGAVVGTIFGVLGLRKAPERIRDIGWESACTSGGMLCVGFGLAFASGLGRGVLVIGGILAYLYGVALGVVKRHGRLA